MDVDLGARKRRGSLVTHKRSMRDTHVSRRLKQNLISSGTGNDVAETEGGTHRDDVALCGFVDVQADVHLGVDVSCGSGGQRRRADETPIMLVGSKGERGAEAGEEQASVKKEEVGKGRVLVEQQMRAPFSGENTRVHVPS